MNLSLDFKKFHDKILKHMKTFNVTIDHILFHLIGNKLGLYVSFQIPLYYNFEVWSGMTFGPLLFCNYFKTVLLAIARTCQYLVDLDLSNCHIINTGSFGILSKLTSLQVSISCSINIPSSLSQFSFYSEIDPSLP